MISISTGIDLVEIERFDHLNPKIRSRFFHRVFTRSELEETGPLLHHLAGKFAAKEAAAKALGTGIGLVSWQDIEVLNNPEGQPRLLLHGNAQKAAQKAGWSSSSISITHTRTHAVAVVTALIDLPAGTENEK